MDRKQKVVKGDESGLGEFASSPCYQHELDPMYDGELDDTNSEKGNTIDPHQPNNWSQVHAWRKQQRARLKAQRERLSDDERQRISIEIARILMAEISLAGKRVGFYWPMDGEVDLRSLANNLLKKRIKMALPVITEKQGPLQFWRYDAESELRVDGVWGIPTPAERDIVDPDVLLVPLLAFDSECHRLGYGGGYYDRTLAAMKPRPLSFGVGYESGRLATVYPQEHDVAMDAIVSEAGIFRCGSGE